MTFPGLEGGGGSTCFTWWCSGCFSSTGGSTTACSTIGVTGGVTGGVRGSAANRRQSGGVTGAGTITTGFKSVTGKGSEGRIATANPSPIATDPTSTANIHGDFQIGRSESVTSEWVKSEPSPSSGKAFWSLRIIVAALP